MNNLTQEFQLNNPSVISSTLKLKERGKALRRFRQAAELSQLALAIDVGTSPSRISDAENGKTEMRTETLQRIANRLGVELNDIANEKVAAERIKPSLETGAFELLWGIHSEPNSSPRTINANSFADKNRDKLRRFWTLGSSERNSAWVLLGQDGWGEFNNAKSTFAVAPFENVLQEVFESISVFFHLERVIGTQLQLLILRKQKNVQGKTESFEILDSLAEYVERMGACINDRTASTQFSEALLGFDLEFAKSNEIYANVIFEFNNSIARLLRVYDWVYKIQPDYNSDITNYCLRIILHASRFEIGAYITAAKEWNINRRAVQAAIFEWDHTRTTAVNAAAIASMQILTGEFSTSRNDLLKRIIKSGVLSDNFARALRDITGLTATYGKTIIS